MIMVLLLLFFQEMAIQRKRPHIAILKYQMEDFFSPHASENKIRAQVFFQIPILPLMRNKRPPKPLH